MYLLFVTICTGLAYIGLFFLFPLFFKNTVPKLTSRMVYPIAVAMFVSIAALLLSLAIPDIALSNRFLHAFGGGFVPFLICFLAARDSKVKINKFQFLVFSFLIVTAFGVANEILEFFLQHYTYLIFAYTIDDTWLDLISNTVGAGFGAICFTIFFTAGRLSDTRNNATIEA